MIEFLLSLPKDVVRDHVVNFLDLASLSRLDSAVISYEHRWNVLNHVLSGSEVEEEVDYGSEMIKWLVLRNIYLKDITFPKDTSDTDLVQASPALLKAYRIELSGCNRISNQGVQNLFRIVKSLENVSLESCSWLADDTLFVLVDNHPNLTELLLKSSPFITNAAIVHIANRCKQLDSLQFANCAQIGDDAMMALRSSESLCSISFGDCPNISEEALLSFLEEGELYSVYTDFNSCVTDKAMEYLANYAPGLKELTVNGCTNISEVGYTVMTNACQDLTMFAAAGSYDLSTSELNAISSNISTNLKVLSLGSHNLNDVHVESIAARATKIETLILFVTPRLTDRFLCSIGAHLPHLTNLTIAGVSKISVAGVQRLTEGCKNLKSLDVSDSTYFQDGCLREVAMRCVNLTELVVKTTMVTDVGIQAVAQHCDNLTSINIGDTDVTAEGVELLIQGCPQLKQIVIDAGLALSVPIALEQLAQQRQIDLAIDGEEEEDGSENGSDDGSEDEDVDI